MLQGRNQDFWAIRCVVVALLAAERTVFPVKEHALADVGFHVTFSCFRIFTGAVTKRTIRFGNFYGTPAGTDWAFLNVGLSHPLYVDYTII